jgi:hypothetical protein
VLPLAAVIEVLAEHRRRPLLLPSHSSSLYFSGGGQNAAAAQRPHRSEAILSRKNDAQETRGPVAVTTCDFGNRERRARIPSSASVRA